MQYYFDTLFPRIPVLVLRTVVANLESMKLPSKHCGVTGETTRGCDETARRPPSVKAALSVSFGQRAPHRTSTRDSSPVRRTVTHSYDKDSESRQSPNHPGSQNGDLSGRDYSGRDRGRERERDRGKDGNSDRERTRDRYGDRDEERGRELERGKERRYHYDKRSRDTYRRNYDRKGREDYRREGSSRQSRSRSRSRSQSQSIHEYSKHNSPFSHESREKIPASSNLAKLKDLYGVLSNQKDGVEENKEGRTRSSGTEEVIRLGGSSWR